MKKSLDKRDLANYHPVSIIPFLGKVIEQAVAIQLKVSLDETVELEPFQSSFRLDFGTKTALVALVDNL